MRTISHILHLLFFHVSHFQCFHLLQRRFFPPAIPSSSLSYLFFMAVAKENEIFEVTEALPVAPAY